MGWLFSGLLPYYWNTKNLITSWSVTVKVSRCVCVLKPFVRNLIPGLLLKDACSLTSNTSLHILYCGLLTKEYSPLMVSLKTFWMHMGLILSNIISINLQCSKCPLAYLLSQLNITLVAACHLPCHITTLF